MNEDTQYVQGKTCVKCPEPAQYAGVDVKKAVYCKPCYINMVKHKFRATLSKRKLFKNDDERECLIVFDGSTASCFLFHQVIEELEQSIYKRLMINPTFVILVSSTDDESLKLVMVRFQEIKATYSSAHWILVHLAAGLSKNNVEMGEGLQGLDQIPHFKEAMSFCKTHTSKEEFRRILKEKTCALTAKSLNMSRIMLPDDADTLGRLALAQLCLGRGGVLNEMTSVIEKRPKGIIFIRPLRDISSKEIAIVSHLEGYEDVAIRTNENNKFSPGSIQAATSNFVDNLFTEGFKATIPTVLSTASKLHTPAAEIICPLCEIGPVEKGADICSCCSSFMNEVTDSNFFKTSLL